MMPSVTVLIPTYARTQLLQEAIFSVLSQDYDGDVEILVFNDCRRQLLSCENPRVHVLNLVNRFSTLGGKRASMIDQAKGDWIALLDDDDLWMPWHLRAALPHPGSSFLASFPKHWFRLAGTDWSWEEVNGGPNILVKTATAMSLNVDRTVDAAPENHWRRSLEGLIGPSIARPDMRPSYVYRPRAAPLHFSQSRVRGDRTPEPFLNDAEARMNDGREPTGDVVLVPQWERPYLHQVAQQFPDTIPKQ